ncbi:MAG: adenylate cyclase [Saprospiraceae bacterium]|jgi:adenylate cyclase
MSKKYRQLAAIVFTDIVGYSAMMRDDEEKATLIRERHRAVFDKTTPEYGGKILQYYGDGTLSVFQSAVSAVECSVEMQKAFQQTPNVPLRIGIHTGDITYSKEEVFGDGLNIASRIEAACIPGGIFISGKVYDDIKNHSSLRTKSVGQFLFKGMNDPIDIYALDCESLPVPTDSKLPHLKESKAKIVRVNSTISGANNTSHSVVKNIYKLAIGLIAILALFYFGRSSVENTEPNYLAASAFSDTDQISIAVLPFSNFSENNKDDYFSDGITEDILTLLSSIKDFRVISRTSVMQYKNTEKSMKQIGRELNATHILEGSVRKSDNKVRIVAQLIDARNDAHLWADTYDRELTEIFEVQSEVAEQIAGTLKKELSPEDCKIIKKKPTENFQAYEFYQQGRKYYRKYNEKDNEIAIQLFQKALDVDSTFALAYAGIGDALSQKANYRSGDPELLIMALQMGKKAIVMDENCSEAYKAMGLSYHYQGDMDKALDSYNKAVEINPNNDMATSNIALIYKQKGKTVEGIKWARKAMELNPQEPMSFLRLSELYESIGMDENAEIILAEGITWNPDNEDLNFKMGNLELKMNQLDKVRTKADELEKIKPESPNIFVLRGKAAFIEKDYEKAQEQLLIAQEMIKKKEGSKEYWGLDMDLAFVDWKLNPEGKDSPKLKEMLTRFQEKDAKHPNAEIQVIIASIYTAMDEEEKAIQYLNKASEHGFLDYKSLENNPVFEALHELGAFINIKEKIRQKAEEIKIVVSKGTS